MRSFERRIEALEKQSGPDDFRLALDALSDADLERLLELITARDAGEWSDLSELPAEDQRIFAQIGVVEAAQ